MSSDLTNSDRCAIKVIRLHGTLNGQGLSTFLQDIVAIAREKPQALLLDMSEVTHVDTFGLKTLLSARKLALALGIELMLRDIPETLERLLEMTGLEDTFAVVASPAEAIAVKAG